MYVYIYIDLGELRYRQIAVEFSGGDGHTGVIQDKTRCAQYMYMKYMYSYIYVYIYIYMHIDLCKIHILLCKFYI